MIDNSSSPFDTAKVVALDTKVSALDKELRQIDTRITGLETKFDNVANSLAHEFRNSLGKLSQQVAERGSTSWGVVFAGCAVAATVIGMIGGLAISPLTTNISELKSSIIRLDERQYNELEKRIDTLAIENRIIQHKLPVPPQ